MRTVSDTDYKRMSTVILPATGGWQSYLWLWGAMGPLAYREDCDGGGGAEDDELSEDFDDSGGTEDDELMGVIIVLK